MGLFFSFSLMELKVCIARLSRLHRSRYSTDTVRYVQYIEHPQVVHRKGQPHITDVNVILGTSRVLML